MFELTAVAVMVLLQRVQSNSDTLKALYYRYCVRSSESPKRALMMHFVMLIIKPEKDRGILYGRINDEAESMLTMLYLQ